MLFRRVLLQAARYKSSAVSANVLDFDDIPTPKGLPFFGTTLSLIAAGSAPQLHKYIDKRHKQLGGVFKEKIGPVSCVFVADPDVIREVFNQEGKYPVHLQPEPWVMYNKLFSCPRGLFFMDGADWWHYRRVVNSVLLKGDTSWISEACDVVSDGFVQELGKVQGAEFGDLKGALYKWSLDVIVSILLGAPAYKQHHEDLQEKITHLARIVHLVFQTTSKLQLIPVSFAAKYKIPQWRRFVGAVDNALHSSRALVDTLVTLNPSENGLLFKLQQHLKPDDIKRIISDLVMASGDTTAVSLEWMLYLIARHKETQKKLRARPEMARFVMRETLRMYPVAIFLTRILPENAVLSGYAVPKGTLVVSSMYTSGRDEHYFPEPHSFKPERWDRKGDMYNVAMQKGSLPFGLGLRSCIGKRIAETQLQTTLLKIVNSFQVECCNKKEVDVVLKMVAHPSEPVVLKFKKL